MKNYLFILIILFSKVSFSQTFPIETILQSGTNATRINMVILSEGYQANELNQFVIDATNFINSLFAEAPYKEYKNYFNVHTIKVPSNQSGANHPGTATDVTEPFHPIITVNNYFESAFDAFGKERLLVVNDSKVSTVLANNFPAYDIVLVLVNSPYYGGSGGQYAVASLYQASKKIAIHELGHSFVNLLDEYYAGDTYATEGINMTQETNPNNVVWKNWMNQNGVEIYQHDSGGNPVNWYKPHQNCKMQYLNNPFCSVCIEGTIEKIHSLTTPLLSYTPQNSGMISITNTIDFDISLIETIPNTINTEWKLNGSVINNNVNSIPISTNDLLNGSNQLQVTIIDETSLLQVENHQTIHFETVVWNINSSLLSIDDITHNSFVIELYPNPTQDILNFKLDDNLNSNYLISINDSQGKQIIEKNINYTDNTIDISNIPSGLYFMRFTFESGLTLTKKIIKN